MQTNYTFESSRFQPAPAELDESHEDFINPGVFARELADFLKTGLSASGFVMKFRCPEDWGYWQEIKHDRNYTLAIGCANLDEIDDTLTLHRVFVTPDKPFVRPLRQWFRKTDVRDDVKQLLDAIEVVLRSDPQISNIKLESP